ncbi:hypothetical protein [Methylotuvimicrobium buryatense]|uniref:CopG family transcriptional regulator n=1 Tax=Methylotuvimicrobium buryatense TaxID=95641 RepID=A0A4P9US17_METBY|nr:hypothetical protein [Methylotuvimicrobium buryatense]QCW84304.1 hypothetical protein EQU24_20275 [Methylotuvimicrobium buryatense]
MKINAELDGQSEQDLLFIQEQTGETIPRIIKELLAEKAESLRQKTHSGAKMKALLESNFVRCAEGPEDLSEVYKDYLYNGLKEKHGID